jgi:hypothetical protein
VSGNVAIYGQDPPPPTFGGAQIFGNVGSFAWGMLHGPGAGQPPTYPIDEFLSLTLGTTQYGPGAGRCIGISGVLIAPTRDGVSALLTTLQSYAGLGMAQTLGVPTRRPWPDNWQWFPNCYFILAELIPSSAGIVVADGGNYSLSYVLNMRQIDTNAQNTSDIETPTAPGWDPNPQGGPWVGWD